MKSVKIFDKVLDKVKPILEIQDLNLKVYHPNILSKAASLSIFDTQNEVSFLNDKLSKKSDELSKLSSVDKLDQKNLDQRKAITREITAINDEIDKNIYNYVETLCKLKPGKLKEIVEEFYNDNEDLDYPKEKLVSDLFNEINQALSEYNEKELEKRGISGQDDSEKNV
ncbi:hypothetical protein NIES2100_05630 [Calothrix sp. NIES-2100]|uniref:hypothetical protein n=1 Tax=Calothrix sp. NIES-2100 TaxID=1954172 RepID=UPI000B606091|nr:hypothetical protein NIES2100_05630 [Calothrix sp. NIES-2100]